MRRTVGQVQHRKRGGRGSADHASNSPELIRLCRMQRSHAENAGGGGTCPGVRVVPEKNRGERELRKWIGERVLTQPCR